ncbi:Endo-1-3(4)-beta-glucanase [Penicillium bovifimosum]|uniref:endo-1,3(4)-beta-glucanase n=1 Tax=Penicillium bovifimosum TaxID=126998 RepID=A0A9W9HG52_9EURO|nr:Endo-1-3(4)-beta-glucanase [Penicillium bovifimosum]KAJ5146504.1 Endo-1-3(4)-beta-glucanase [Penicillium bovifimosum]
MDEQLPQYSLQPHYSGASGDPIPESKTPITTSQPQPPARRHFPRYNPRWTTGLIVASVIIGILLIAIVTPIELSINQIRYPNYSPLDYKLVDDYSGPTFFDQFTYFTDDDPTKGFVIYVNESTARSLNLTYASGTSAVLRVDAVTPNATAGRNSVRIESKKTYDTGLFVFDIIHTPFGCATWPALWLTDGYYWPENGEIDVLETTNQGSHGNEVTLHTTKGCKMDVKRKQTGQTIYTDCHSDGNAGCGVAGDEFTYGEAMNRRGGGVYALEIRKEGIRAWFFPRADIPADVIAGSPEPSAWGTALADFPGTDCDIAGHFRNQSIIANIDLCGELAAQKQYYETLYHCPATCTGFVERYPAKFGDAYWEFRSFKVYRA